MITAAVLDKILAFLAPLFRDVTPDDAAARKVARSTLDSYGARDDRELRFAALSIAFSFGALDALSRAAQPDQPPNQVLRLRGNANALSRAALQNEARLEKARRQPAGQAENAPPQQAAPGGERPLLPESAGSGADLPASCETPDLVDFVRAARKAEKAAAAAAPPPMSRQQRRFAERQAEKQRQRELKQARLAQRATQRHVGEPIPVAMGA
jgi:hypothetical protein